MNFIEAVRALKEGKAKRIRRRKWDNGFHVKPVFENQISLFRNNRKKNFRIEDVLADDWQTD